MSPWVANVAFVVILVAVMGTFRVLQDRYDWLERHDWIGIVLWLGTMLALYVFFAHYGFVANPQLQE